nr:MAG TPA: hypothetical protein [Caudoviricetes sp.]
MMQEEEKENGAAETESEEVGEEEVKDEEKAESEPSANEGDDGKEDGKSEKKAQSKSVNARFAQERREREAQAKAKAEKEAREAERRAYVKGQVDTLKTNPYTGDPITDETDLEQYKVMKELDEKGDDPLKGFAKAWADRTRSEMSKREQAQAKKAEEAKQAQKEVDDLVAAYPGLDVPALVKDDAFQKFASGKYGRWTLTEIYETYKAKDGRQAESKPRAKSSPSSMAGGTSEPKSINDMTDDEFLRYRSEKYGY